VKYAVECIVGCWRGYEGSVVCGGEEVHIVPGFVVRWEFGRWVSDILFCSKPYVRKALVAAKLWGQTPHSSCFIITGFIWEEPNVCPPSNASDAQ
jgi:hypothetical protein